MLSLLQWLTILYCIPTILCRRFRLTCSNDLDSLYFGMCVAFFNFYFKYMTVEFYFCFGFLCLFLYSQVCELLVVQPELWTQKKETVGIKKGKCPASGFLCMFLQPITNVTFQIALDSCTSNKKVEKKKAGFCVLINFYYIPYFPRFSRQQMFFIKENV